MGKTVPPAFTNDEDPGPLRYLFDWFVSLCVGRTIEALNWTELQAWSNLTGTELEPWEAEALKRLDHLFLLAYNPKK